MGLKKRVFPARQRTWDNSLYGKPVIHGSVKLRTKNVENVPDAGYTPWILKHEPEIERWTHLADWREDKETFGHVDPDDLNVLEGWCAPMQP